jgi:hypothetical protein
LPSEKWLYVVITIRFCLQFMVCHPICNNNNATIAMNGSGTPRANADSLGLITRPYGNHYAMAAMNGSGTTQANADTLGLITKSIWKS